MGEACGKAEGCETGVANRGDWRGFWGKSTPIMISNRRVGSICHTSALKQWAAQAFKMYHPVQVGLH